MNGSAEDLLQRVLEGDATPEERERLEALLTADPALRRRRDEMEHVFHMLESARLSPAPISMREEVMRAVSREAAGAPRPPMAVVRRAPAWWPRLLLPVTAAAAAVVLLWALRTPVLKNGPTTSGTMGAQQNSVRVLVGEGADAVEVRSLGTAQGFRLEIAAGASGGSIELAVTGGGARMNHSPDGEVSASETLRREFQAAERWSVFGWTTAHEIPLRIVVRHPDGREASRRIEVKARRGPGPGG